MKYNYIIFDIDGTLLDTEYAVLHSLQQTVESIQGKKTDLADLRFALGIPGKTTLQKLGMEDKAVAGNIWNRYMKEYLSEVKLFEGITGLLATLSQEGMRLGIVTSRNREEYQREFLPYGLDSYFDAIVCAGDTALCKPFPDPLLACLNALGANAEESLYVGDSIYDAQCAQAAGVDFALALWGNPSVKHICATWYFRSPADLFHTLQADPDPFGEYPLVRWAMELQFMAQAGITYSKDPFDRERFERLREISAEMMSVQTGFPINRIHTLFCNETGFQTPKLDTRAAIFEEGKILLVKEKNGTWSLPGGWVDVNQSVGENTIKEVKEESGLDVVPVRLIALQDRNRHNEPLYAYGVCKVFVLCQVLGGEFVPNTETVESHFFAEDELPVPLAEEKNNVRQIRMCFEAYRSENWVTLFD